MLFPMQQQALTIVFRLKKIYTKNGLCKNVQFIWWEKCLTKRKDLTTRRHHLHCQRSSGPVLGLPHTCYEFNSTVPPAQEEGSNAFWIELTQESRELRFSHFASHDCWWLPECWADISANILQEEPRAIWKIAQATSPLPFPAGRASDGIHCNWFIRGFLPCANSCSCIYCTICHRDITHQALECRYELAALPAALCKAWAARLLKPSLRLCHFSFLQSHTLNPTGQLMARSKGNNLPAYRPRNNSYPALKKQSTEGLNTLLRERSKQQHCPVSAPSWYDVWSPTEPQRTRAYRFCMTLTLSKQRPQQLAELGLHTVWKCQQGASPQTTPFPRKKRSWVLSWANSRGTAEIQGGFTHCLFIF